MKRRDLLKLGGAAAIGAGAARILPAQMQSGMPMQGNAAPAPEGKADITLQIAPVALELAPNRIISTIGYNGMCPGPILRMKEGVPVTVDVINETDTPEFVHWHGLLFRPKWTARRKKELRRCLPTDAAATNSLRSPPERAGITRTPWPAPICTKAPIPGSSDS